LLCIYPINDDLSNIIFHWLEMNYAALPESLSDFAEELTGFAGGGRFVRKSVDSVPAEA
jgi:hypothetical protein